VSHGAFTVQNVIPFAIIPMAWSFSREYNNGNRKMSKDTIDAENVVIHQTAWT